MCGARPDYIAPVAIHRLRAISSLLFNGVLRFPVGFLRELMSLGGMLHGPARLLVTRHVIFFSMRRGGNAVGLRGEIVEFSCSLM
jgi:hypothetical protein